MARRECGVEFFGFELGDRALHCVADQDAWWDHAGQCSDIAVVRGWHDASVPLQIALLDATALPAAA